MSDSSGIHVLDLRMSLAFVSAMAILIVVAKVISALDESPPPRLRLLFWLTLLPSVRSLSRMRIAGPGERRRAVVWFLCVAVVSCVAYLGCVWAIRAFGINGFCLGYIGAPILWLMGELAPSLSQVITLPSGRLLPLPHRNIFASRSLGDFWGRRWNIWMSDWFRQMLFEPLRRYPLLAVGLVFLFSGILHELVINLSLWIITGRNLFGSMMIYFGLQGAGLIFERRFLAGRPVCRRVVAWLVVLGPVPLIVNEGILRAFWLWVE